MATAATDVLDALNWRYAVKAFSSQQVQPGDLRVLLEAARLSPSSYGLQPYQVIAISNRALREELIPHSYGQDKVLHSSHLLVFAAHTDVGDHTVERFVAQSKRALGLVPDSLESYAAHMKDALAKKSDAERLNWAKQQAYIALGNVLTSAALMRIDACPVTGVDMAAYDRVLGLDAQSLATTVICPIGYREQGDKYASKPKVRFDYDDIIVEV